MLYDYFTYELTYLLIFLSFIGIIGIFLQYKLYRKFKKRVNAEIILQKDKKELFEKFRI
jgi:hypothetical protein